MKNSIKINGQEVELPQELIDQITKVVESKKLPSWDEVYDFSNGRLKLEIGGLSDLAHDKIVVYAKLLAVAKYLNGDWKPKFYGVQSNWEIYHGRNTLKVFVVLNASSLGVSFHSREAAEKAIEIFRHNGDEQNLIDFFTK